MEGSAGDSDGDVGADPVQRRTAVPRCAARAALIKLVGTAPHEKAGRRRVASPPQGLTELRISLQGTRSSQDAYLADYWGLTWGL